jgi:hypothetical protein
MQRVRRAHVVTGPEGHLADRAGDDHRPRHRRAGVRAPGRGRAGIGGRGGRARPRRLGPAGRQRGAAGR